MSDRGIPAGDAFTPELLARLWRWTAEACVYATPEAVALGLRAHGIGVVDLDRVRHLIDERVYESALLRARAAETRPTVTYRPGGLDDPNRDRYFQAIQLACAGALIGTALAAQIDSLAASIAVAATDRANAERIIADVAADLAKAVDDNWQSVKDQIALAERTSPHG